MSAFPAAAARPWLATAGVVWVLVAAISGDGTPPEGVFEGEVTLVTEPRSSRDVTWAIGELSGGRALIDLGDLQAGRGDRLVAEGVVEHRSSGAVLDSPVIHRHIPTRHPVHLAGRWVRSAVLKRLEPFDEGRSLLAGFLIGAIDRVRPDDMEAMRTSGLSHFVAVSGSNVALLLTLVALAGGPLLWSPRRRALACLAVIPVYAAATGFEPSVLRASAMATIVLIGRLTGVVLDPWQTLSAAIVLLILSDGSLVNSVGFQLSVAATTGVLFGSKLGTSRIARGLSIGLGAQLAVAPILLVHFGSVPLLSPLANLIAAPLVAVSTFVGAVGSLGLTFLIEPASWLARGVLVIARTGSAWPQIGASGVAALTLAALVAALVPRARGTLAAGAGAVVVLVMLHNPLLPPAGVAVLDVGQGDAILIHGGSGRYALVDGGADPATLVNALRRYGVRSIELLVVSHPHRDHIGGLEGLAGRYSVSRVWADLEHHGSASTDRLQSRLHGVWSVPEVRDRYDLGVVGLTVLGPVRRYVSANDQSIVIAVSGPKRTMLLTGDIESHAQMDLRGIRADILKVPHHGGGTSDADWLLGVGASTAVISVGPNEFGHPTQWVLDLFESQGTAVLRTDIEGDVLLSLG